MNGRVLLSVFSVLLFVVSTKTVFAQAPDVRLTNDPTIAFLPQEIRIQDAAQNGSRILAVWGTTYLGTDGIVQNGLVSQILENGTPLGTPQLIHSEAAQPEWRVFVVPYKNGFQVFWNDVRSNESGMYGRSLDLYGQLISNSERRFDTSYIGVLRHYGIRQDGSVVFHWQTASSISSVQYVWRVLADGTFDGEFKELLGEVTDRYVLDSGEEILRLVNGAGYKVLHDGRISDKTIPAGRLGVAYRGGAYHLQESGELTTLPCS